MKKLILASALIAGVFGFSATAVSAAPGYGTAGCGLGSIVFGPGGGIVQIFAATTNGTYYNQMFGITSGTSNCVEGGATGYIQQQQEVFVHVNYRGLQQEMAAGKGEKVTAFAGLLGCNADQFGSVSQKAHSSLFTAETAQNPSALLVAVKAAVVSNGLTCTNI